MKKLILLFISFSIFSCNNESIEQLEEQVLPPCDNIFVGDVILTTQEQVDVFGAMGYCQIEGFLLIGQHYGFDNDITDLTALSTLTSITRSGGLEHSGKLNIYAYNLSSLMGLHNLTSVASLNISICNALVDLNGLNSLEEVTGFDADFGGLFHIKDNPQLSSLDGLENLHSIGLNSTNIFDVRISGIEIQNLTGLSNLTHIKGNTIVGVIPRLLNLEGLERLESVDGNFTIAANHDLLNLDGLNNLESVNGDLTIGANSNLLNLDSLSSLNVVSGSISTLAIPPCNGCTPAAIGNQELINLCGFENLLRNGTYQDVTIEDNAYNPTVQDIIDGNCAQ